MYSLFTFQTTTWTRALQMFGVVFLAVSLAVLGAGCGGAGSNGSSNGDGGNDGNNNGGGNGDDEPDTTAPGAPTDLSGDSGNEKIDLTWATVSASDVAGYNVYRSTSSIEGVSGINPRNGTLLSETSYTDTEVQNGTKYYYVITAVDTADNESGMSNEVHKTPFANPPDRP